jgi:hypothetical protein
VCQVGEEVRLGFYAYGESEEAVAGGDGEAGLAGVGHGQGVGDERLYAAEAGGDAEEVCAVHYTTSRVAIAADLE